MDGIRFHVPARLHRAWQRARATSAPTGWARVAYRVRNGLAATLYATACACTQAPAPGSAGGVVSTPAAASATAPPPAPAPAPVRTDFTGTPCVTLAAIDQFPDRFGTPMTDPDYVALRDSGRAAIPCLVEAVASDAPMASPQTGPAGGPFTVGDMAFLLLVDFGYVDFLQALPPEVQAVAQSRGAFAYFDWIAAPGNRVRLRERVATQVAKGEAVAARAP